jgi:hypothetical protein
MVTFRLRLRPPTPEPRPHPNLQLFVVDTRSGTVFGPFPSGTNIKYVEGPGATPNQRAGPDTTSEW